MLSVLPIFGHNKRLVTLVILSLFVLLLSMPWLMREHSRLSVVIMHCVIRDTGLRSKMTSSLVLNLGVVIMRL